MFLHTRERNPPRFAWFFMLALPSSNSTAFSLSGSPNSPVCTITINHSPRSSPTLWSPLDSRPQAVCWEFWASKVLTVIDADVILHPMYFAHISREFVAMKDMNTKWHKLAQLHCTYNYNAIQCNTTSSPLDILSSRYMSLCFSMFCRKTGTIPHTLSGRPEVGLQSACSPTFPRRHGRSDLASLIDEAPQLPWRNFYTCAYLSDL